MRAFLVQSSRRSHEGRAYWNPDYKTSDEVLKGHYYYFPTWDIAKYHGGDFRRIQPGDRIVHYFTKSVTQYPQQIPLVSEVTKVEYVPQAAAQNAVNMGWLTQSEANLELSLPRILRLNFIHLLRRPIQLNEIDQLIASGHLTNKMGSKCSQEWFNLTEMPVTDYAYAMSR